MRSLILSCPIILTLSVAALNDVYADSATWSMNPTSGDWNTAENWNPEIVPTDVATFGVSTITDVSVAADTAIRTISFAAGANPFTIRTIPGTDRVTLTISGTGITNDSGTAQNFVVETDANNDSGFIQFTGGATVSALTTITAEANSSGQFNWGAFTSFEDHSSAGDGTFHCLGSSVPSSAGAGTAFDGDSTAGTATLTSDGGSVAGAGGGTIWFFDSSLARLSSPVMVAQSPEPVADLSVSRATLQ